MNRQEFLESRRKGIGGSDVAPILKQSKWSSPLSVYMDKLGISPDTEETEYMYWGNVHESAICNRFSELSEKKLMKPKGMFVDKEHDFLIANVDMLIDGESAGFEAKTCNAFSISDWDNAVPDAYMLQCQHYMSVTGLDTWYLGVLIGGNTFRWFTIEKDDDFIKSVRVKLVDFWQNNVLKEIPPELASIDLDLVKDTYNKPEEKSLKLNAEMVSNVCKFQIEKQKEKEAKTEKERLQAEICNYLGNNIQGDCEHYIITWKPQSRSTIDSKKLKIELPDIYEQYLNVSESRKFNIKELKT